MGDNYERYGRHFGRMPTSAANRAAMNEQLNLLNRQAYEENQYGSNNNNDWYYPNNNDEPYFNANAQREKLKQLHRVDPDVGISMAEELQQAIGNPIPFKRYVRRRQKQGVPFEQAVEEYSEGGIATEGVGKSNAPNTNPNAQRVLRKQNAQNRGLLASTYNPSYEANILRGKAKSRRRRSRRSRSRRNRRKTRRT
jgi:hypothetical protein